MIGGTARLFLRIDGRMRTFFDQVLGSRICSVISGWPYSRPQGDFVRFEGVAALEAGGDDAFQIEDGGCQNSVVTRARQFDKLLPVRFFRMSAQIMVSACVVNGSGGVSNGDRFVTDNR
jgi:hypothetical protein